MGSWIGRWIAAFLIGSGIWAFLVSGDRVDGMAPTPGEIWNIAHRGASAHAPESTLPAFMLAEKMGADWIELDVQMTRDGHLVALHDDQVDRTTNGKGPVRNFTLAELKQLDAGTWFGKKYPRRWKPEYQGTSIPTLGEVFTQMGDRVRYCLEIKENSAGPRLEGKLLQLLKQHGLWNPAQPGNQVVIQSFDRQSLKRLHHQAPEITLIQLIHFQEARSVSPKLLREIQVYAEGIGYHHRQMDRDDVRRAQSHGLRIHPYTVNRKKDMRRLIRWGVDGICTNYPDRLQRVLKESAS